MKFLATLLLGVILAVFASGSAVHADEPCDTWFQLLLHYQGELAYEETVYAQYEAEYDALVSVWADAKALWLVFPTQANYDAMVAAEVAKEAKKAQLLEQYQRLLTLESWIVQTSWQLQWNDC